MNKAEVYVSTLRNGDGARLVGICLCVSIRVEKCSKGERQTNHANHSEHGIFIDIYMVATIQGYFIQGGRIAA